MKRLTLLILTLISLSARGQWNNPAVASIGKEPSRSRFMSYERRDDAVFDFARSAYYRSLNGEWSFRVAPSPDEVDLAFYRSPSSTQKMAVPSFWETTTAADLGTVRPQMLPSENHVGQYVKEIVIPVTWLDRDIFLNISGVRSAFSLYVNGTKIGYSEDGSIPAEFNISNYVSDGKNFIGIELYRWSTASWLENNTIGGVGIGDGVYIYSQPKVHISDFVVDAKLDSSLKNGVLDLDIIVANNYNNSEKVTVYFDLMNSRGEIIRYNYREVEIAPSGRDTVHYTAAVQNVTPWSSATPEQYQLMMRLRQNGRFTEYVPFKIGFRSVEKRGDEFVINGKPTALKIKPCEFLAVSPDDKTLLAELSKIKKEGYNTISCGYHPNKSHLYQLCSEVGLYVIDIINIDTSLTGKDLSLGGNLGNVPAWVNSFTYRAENSYGAIRNNASVIDWRVGQNVGVGYNVYKLNVLMNELGKKYVGVE